VGEDAVLSSFGIDVEIESVYRKLLEEPHATVAVLAERLGRTEPQIRQALDVLADLALLRPSLTTTGRMIPVSPAVGLETMLRRQEEYLAMRRRALEAGRAAARAVRGTARAAGGTADDTDADPDLERVLGADAVQTRLEEIVSSAESEVLSLVPGRAIPQGALAAASVTDDLLMHRGVKCKILYQDSVRTDPATVAYGRWLAERGSEIRTAAVLPMRLLVIDRRVALVPLNPDNPREGALSTTAPGMVGQLTTLFELVWAEARPLETRSADSDEALSPGERELLRMLATGFTDEASANRLGVSLRTVRRMMADLMARLGATSRFEAGLKAAKRGWL